MENGIGIMLSNTKDIGEKSILSNLSYFES